MVSAELEEHTPWLKNHGVLLRLITIRRRMVPHKKGVTMTDAKALAAVQNGHVYVLYHCPECGVQTAAAPYRGNLQAAVEEALRISYIHHDARHTRCRFRPDPEAVHPNPPLYPSPVQQ